MAHVFIPYTQCTLAGLRQTTTAAVMAMRHLLMFVCLSMLLSCLVHIYQNQADEGPAAFRELAVHLAVALVTLAVAQLFRLWARMDRKVSLMISSIVVAPGSLFWLHALFTLMAWMLHAPEEIRVRYLTDMANVNFLTGNCLDTICRVVIYSGMGGMFGAKLNMHRRWRWAAACTNCVGLVMWAAVCEATLGLEQHTSWFVKYSLLPIAIGFLISETYRGRIDERKDEAAGSSTESVLSTTGAPTPPPSPPSDILHALFESTPFGRWFTHHEASMDVRSYKGESLEDELTALLIDGRAAPSEAVVELTAASAIPLRLRHHGGFGDSDSSGYSGDSGNSRGGSSSSSCASGSGQSTPTQPRLHGGLVKVGCAATGNFTAPQRSADGDRSDGDNAGGNADAGTGSGGGEAAGQCQLLQTETAQMALPSGLSTEEILQSYAAALVWVPSPVAKPLDAMPPPLPPLTAMHGCAMGLPTLEAKPRGDLGAIKGNRGGASFNRWAPLSHSEECESEGESEHEPETLMEVSKAAATDVMASAEQEERSTQATKRSHKRASRGARRRAAREEEMKEAEQLEYGIEASRAEREQHAAAVAEHADTNAKARAAVECSILRIVDAYFQRSDVGLEDESLTATQASSAPLPELPAYLNAMCGPDTDHLVAGVLRSAMNDGCVVRGVLRALEAAPPSDAGDATASSPRQENSSVHGRLQQRLQQRQLEVQRESAKRQLNGYLEELHTIQKALLCETAVVDAEAATAELASKLSALAQWQQTLLKDPLVAHARSLQAPRALSTTVQP